MTQIAPPGMPGMPPRPGGPGGFGPLDGDTHIASDLSMEEVAAKLASVSSPEPEMEATPELQVNLPGGLLLPTGEVVRVARVRELTGYDEEHLARVDGAKNAAVFMTELLLAGVDELNGIKPERDTIRNLLIGDRDALMLGIRKATYGDTVKFTLTCGNCGEDNDLEIDLNTDIPVTVLQDPLERIFEVPLRRGSAQVTLLTGIVQEAFAENMDRKTQAEVNTVMLSKSVTSIRGIQTFGQAEPVKALSAGDRDTLIDFIREHQPGPQFREIPVPCAVCRTDFQIILGLPNLFRF